MNRLSLSAAALYDFCQEHRVAVPTVTLSFPNWDECNRFRRSIQAETSTLIFNTGKAKVGDPDLIVDGVSYIFRVGPL